MILEDRINKFIEAYDRNRYLHGSILIGSNKNILLNKGFGMANWEHKVPNTPKTKFRIGSITKAFTAMGTYKCLQIFVLINGMVKKKVAFSSLFNCLTRL